MNGRTSPTDNSHITVQANILKVEIANYMIKASIPMMILFLCKIREDAVDFIQMADVSAQLPSSVQDFTCGSASEIWR